MRILLVVSKTIRTNFWKKYSLNEFNQVEWETLCDGCGKCCLIKLENTETADVHYTKIACRLFDDKTCKCGNYQLRQKLVSNCVILTKNNIKAACEWMPKTCAYRLIHEGKDLKPWHHLISGSTETVHEAGISLQNSTIPEYDIPENQWEDYILPLDGS